MAGQIRKVVLAYSGGLDTSVILRWLGETYGCEVIAFLADLGQGENMAAARARAQAIGASQVVIEDLREVFVRDYVFAMLRANALYEGAYMMGTAIARPLIARRQVEIARQSGADALCHGATGKGNDQIRFELGYAALAPDLQVIAPWREWAMRSRRDLLSYAQARGVALETRVEDEPPFSIDANLFHRSCEGKALEDPARAAPAQAWALTAAPEDAPDRPVEVEVGFAAGDPVSLDGAALPPAALLARANQLAGQAGVGRLDMVENRFTGIKSRGVYETPGGTLLLAAHRALEQITLDAGAAHLKDELMPRYAELIYNGLWFSPEREMLQALIDHSQSAVAGRVRLKLYKGSLQVVGRAAAGSLYSPQLASFDKDTGYDQRDAQGFIGLTGLRLKRLAARERG